MVKVNSHYAMEVDMLSGGIGPLVFNLGSKQMWLVRPYALVTLLPEKKLELEAEWVLELIWMCWRRDSSLAADKIWTPDLPAYIQSYWLLPHTDLKIKVHFYKMRWEIWIQSVWFMTEIPKTFSEHGNWSWSSLRGKFL